MTNKLKPAAHMHYFIGGYPPDGYYEDFELIKPCDLEEYPVENNEAEGVIPLYMIPAGYSLVKTELLSDISSMCVGEIAMWHKLDAVCIGNMIFEATGLTQPELAKAAKESV